jgi:hypothetical protein
MSRLVERRVVAASSLALVAAAAIVGSSVASPGCTDEPPPPPVVPADAIARFTTDAAELIGGIERAGRVGDVRLDNGDVRFMVQGENAPPGWSTYGGAIVDADLSRTSDQAGDDRLKELFFQCGLRSFQPTKTEIVAYGSRARGEGAIVRMTGRDAGFPYIDAVLGMGTSPLDLEITIDLLLPPSGRTLEIVLSALDRQGVGELSCGPILLPGDTLQIFTPGRGFGEVTGRIPYLAAASPEGRASWVLYRKTSGLDSILPIKEIMPLGTELQSTIGGRYEERFFLSMGDGDVASALDEQRRVVGDASATSTLELTITSAAGREAERRAAWVVLRDPSRKVKVDGADVDFVVTAARALAGDVARLRAPPGSYRAELVLDGRLGGTADVDLRAGEVTQASAALPEGGRVQLFASERSTDGARRPATVRLSLMAGAGAAPDAPIAHQLYLRPGDAANVPAGRYTGYVTKGPRHTREVLAVDVVDGRTTVLTATVTEVVPSAGRYHADLHLHATGSTDSEVALRDRVLGAVGEGLDVILSTEHDIVVDYAPVVAALGLDGVIVPESGSEVSPLYGHINAFPLPVSPTPGPRHWPVQWSKYDGTRYLGLAGPSEVFDAIQELGAQIIQANHPRGNSGVFDRVGFDPDTGVTREPLPPYDAFEVMNGAGGDVDAGLRDLVGIIRLGRRITGTGTSDSHGFGGAPGYGRTVVLTDLPRLDAGGKQALWSALEAGRAIATNGPLVSLEVRGAGGARAGLGETVASGGQPVTIDVVVEAAPWIPLDRVRVYADGVSIAERELTGDAPLRGRFTVTATPARDTFYYATVEGSRPMAPVHRARPRAVANPVFVDVDGGGFVYRR